MSPRERIGCHPRCWTQLVEHDEPAVTIDGEPELPLGRDGWAGEARAAGTDWPALLRFHADVALWLAELHSRQCSEATP